MASLLHTLPPCLIVELCDFLDVSSLGLLRLTSKSLKILFDAPFLRLCHGLPIDLSKVGLRLLRNLAAASSLESGIRDLTLTCVLYECPHPHRPGPYQCLPSAHHLSLPRWKNRAKVQSKRLRRLDFSAEADKLWMERRRTEQQKFSGEDMCVMLAAVLGELRGLKTITLTARVIGPDRRNYRLPEDVEHLHWRELQAHAIQAYRIVMSAIARSQVSIEGLHIYRGVKLCGVPTNEVGIPLDRLEAEGFAVVAQRYLKSFSIRLTSVVDPIRETDTTADDTEFYEPFDISHGRILDHNDRQLIERECDPAGLARLLRLMPNLDSLDLHLFTRIRERPDETASYRAFLQPIIQDLRFPHLKDLALAGFWATEESMRRIIQDHPSLRALTIRHFHLTDGSWEPIFTTLAHVMMSLTRLYLSSLYSSDTHLLTEFNTACMNVNPSDASDSHNHLPGLDGDPMWDVRAIELDELRHGLTFPSMPRGGMASRERWNWLVYWTVDFGPLPWGD